MATRIVRLLVLALAPLACALPAAAAATPAVVPGWPVVAPVGPVAPGPGGGVVVIAHGDRFGRPPALALRADGSRRWLVIPGGGCGNCHGLMLGGLQVDGTYGPVGYAGSTVSSGGEQIPPRVDLDASGLAVVTLPSNTTLDRQPYTSRLIALDAATGAARWQRETPEPLPRPTDERAMFYSLGAEVVAELPSGFLVRQGEPHRLIALSAAGEERWTRPLSLETTVVTRSIVDAARGRAYLGFVRGSASWVEAVALSDGRTLWRTPRVLRAGALLSQGPSGRIYVAALFGRSWALTALDGRGRPVWRYPVIDGADGAVELDDGTVVLTMRPVGAYGDGLAARIDPRRRAAPVERSGVALSRRRVVRCVGYRRCRLAPAANAILRIDLRRAARLRLRVVGPPGAPAVTIDAPAGRTHMLTQELLWYVRPGRHTLEIRWREGDRREVHRLPVEVSCRRGSC